MAHVYVDSNAVGSADGSDWANAYTTLAAALTGAAVAGNNFWEAQDHAESAGATNTLTSPGTDAAPCTVICVNKAGTVPPVAADFLTTGSITTTGAFGITFNTGQSYWYGTTFNCGTGSSGASISFNAVGHQRFESCGFNLLNTNAFSSFGIGNGNGNDTKEFKDCTFAFAATGQKFNIGSGRFKISGGTIGATGSIPAALAAGAGGSKPGEILIENVDMSNLSGKLLSDSSPQIKLTLLNCKLHASATKKPVTPNRGVEVVIINVSSADVNYEQEKHTYEGTHETSITVKRTNGFSDGTTGLSARFETNAGASIAWPFMGLPIPGWHDSEGSNITVTVEGVADPRHFSALPTNAEFWLDLSYLGTAGNPLGVTKSGRPATILTAGSAYEASTEAWDTGATARANTTVYAAGDVIKLASNAGRIFICTTGGTTNGSEPAGYASAVDGGSVTDGTAVFKAGWRFKAVVTTTAAPQNKGPINVFPVMAKASSVLYLDPKLTVA